MLSRATSRLWNIAGRRSVSSASANPSSHLKLVCSGCNAEVWGSKAAVFRCPDAASRPEIDHVLVPAAVDDVAMRAEDPTSTNPFVRYRNRLFSHRVARARGMTDTDYVDTVEALNAALVATGGIGFAETPLLWHAPLNCFFKVEVRLYCVSTIASSFHTHRPTTRACRRVTQVGNVGQSHKARHLANAMIYLLALRRTGDEALGSRRLAVASCGNAGLAAAEVAAAAQWPIDVCIPPDATDAVVARLAALAPRGVATIVCDRSGADVQTAMGLVPSTGAADPTLAVCRELVRAHGSIPFSVQGPECGLAVEGGRTIAWEILTALGRDHAGVRQLGAAYIQVGGGALGAGFAQGMHHAVAAPYASASAASAAGASSHPHAHLLTSEPQLVCVQPEGCMPLHRAWERMLSARVSAHEAARARSEYMWPWDEPHSIAHGILDDETYDWVALCDAMARTGGRPESVREDAIVRAHAYARDELGISTCHTGAAGLAALMTRRAAEPPPPQGAPPDLVLLSGIDRLVVLPSGTSQP